MMKIKPTTLILFVLFSCNLLGQINQKDFEIKDLYLFHKQDSTYGIMDGGMGQFDLMIIDYSFFSENDSVNISGKIVDKDTKDEFCWIQAYIGTNNHDKQKLFLEQSFKVNCNGEFNIKSKISTENKLYFTYIGHSTLECNIYDLTIKNQNRKLEHNTKKSENRKEIFTVIEQMPEYNGGLKKLTTDINNELQLDKSVSGNVYINFTIDSEGRASGFKSLKGISYETDNKIISILTILQNWIPAQNRGKKIKCEYTIKVIIKNGKAKNK